MDQITHTQKFRLNLSSKMSLRMKSNDHFWWTFFHEAGHVSLHRGKTFIDENKDAQDKCEQEANEWAIEQLVGNKRFTKLKAVRPCFKVQVRNFVESINIHPGIIVGMLQHVGIIPYENMYELIDTALRRDRAGFRDLVGDTTRGNVFAFLNHQLDSGVEFYSEASYYRSGFDRQREQAAILSSNRIVVPATAFYNPFGVPLQIRRFRPIDAGPRHINVDNDSFRFLSGFRGQARWSVRK